MSRSASSGSDAGTDGACTCGATGTGEVTGAAVVAGAATTADWAGLDEAAATGKGGGKSFAVFWGAAVNCAESRFSLSSNDETRVHSTITRTGKPKNKNASRTRMTCMAKSLCPSAKLTMLS